MKSHELDFYYFEACPYCQKVMTVISENKIKVNFKHIYDDLTNMQKLLHITGRKTVPCLFIDGQPMHESSDIVAWLKTNINDLKKTE